MAHAIEIARGLERRLAETGGAGYDPYDGLTSPLLRPFWRQPFLARVAMQAVKRAPWNLRPALGIRRRVYTKTLSDMAQAAFRLHRTHGAAADRDRGLECIALLRQRRLADFAGSCWGMELPYASRFVTATPSTPNLFQTVNACNAFLDAHDATHDPAHLDVALGVVEFLGTGLGHVEASDDTVVWRYYPGSDAVVYNVNASIAAALARLGDATGRDDLRVLARRTLHGVVQAQDRDGSWQYARGPAGAWIDGFHTGYVLEALLECAPRLHDAAAATGLERGAAFFAERLLDADGTPRYTTDSRHPIEIQNCAQAVQLLARLALTDRERWLPLAQRALAAACVHLQVDLPGGGVTFRLQRGRWLRNDLEAPRWGLGPMLLALAWLDAAERPPVAASAPDASTSQRSPS